MIYYYGKEEYLIEIELNRLLGNSEEAPIYFNNTSNTEDIFMEINTISLFGNNKIIIIKDHTAFKDRDIAKEMIIKLQDSKMGNTKVIFINTMEANKSNPLHEYLLKNVDNKYFDSIKQRDVPKLIIKIVQDNNGTITNSGSIKLANKLPNNIRLIVGEIKKLLLESKEITDKQIDNSIGEYINENFYALSNAIVNMDKRGIISIYNSLKKNSEKPITIIGKISNSLNLSVVIHYYKKQGISNNEIKNILNLHPFRFQKANDLLLQSTHNFIENIIVSLAILENKIRTGLINPEKGLDKFMLDLIK